MRNIFLLFLILMIPILGQDITNKLGGNNGSESYYITDSGGNVLFRVRSDGRIYLTNSVSFFGAAQFQNDIHLDGMLWADHDVGQRGQILSSLNTSGVKWIDAPKANYQISSQGNSISLTEWVTIGYFAWQSSYYNNYSNGILIFDIDDLVDREAEIRVYISSSDTVLGSSGVLTTSGVKWFSITQPKSNARLEIQARKSSILGTDPKIYGIQLEFNNSN